MKPGLILKYTLAEISLTKGQIQLMTNFSNLMGPRCGQRCWRFEQRREGGRHTPAWHVTSIIITIKYKPLTDDKNKPVLSQPKIQTNGQPGLLNPILNSYGDLTSIQTYDVG